MGRTLHYTVTTEKSKFTNRESEAMLKVSRAMNINPEVWTCESFWIDPFAYYPFWVNNGGNCKDQKQIDKRYDELSKTRLKHADIIKQLIKEKLVISQSEKKNECGGVYQSTRQ